MTPIDDLDQQLDRARLGLSSMLDAKARVRARLAAGGAFASPGAAGGKLLATSRGVPVVVSAALMGVSFAAGYWLRDVGEAGRRREAVALQTPSPLADARPPAATPAAPEVRSPAPQPPAPSFPPSDAAAPHAHAEPKPPPRASSRRSRSRAPAPPATAAAPQVNPATSSDELALLRRAERAIRAGDPALALILLDQLDRTYPTSALGEERTAARLLVECARSGGLAKPEAVRFLEKHPSTVYSDRIVRACRLEALGAAESSADVRGDGH